MVNWMIRIIKSYTLNYTFHSWDSICYTVFVLYVFVICIYRIAVCYGAKTMYFPLFEKCAPLTWANENVLKLLNIHRKPVIRSDNRVSYYLSTTLYNDDSMTIIYNLPRVTIKLFTNKWADGRGLSTIAYVSENVHFILWLKIKTITTIM